MDCIAPVPACDPGSAMPAGWQQGAFMQIFVRAWRDSNGDGIGDLRGLIASLPYLHDLGVRGLWLMPIHPSEDGDHGYAVTDYRAVEPAYGTLADFDELLREAHARGIGVIIDYVINHSALQHPLFQQSRLGPDNPYRDWYVWSRAAPIQTTPLGGRSEATGGPVWRELHPSGWRIHEQDPWRRDGEASYFAAFSRHMPDFNWLNPAVVEWHHDNLRFWLNRGVDGFRFDAVGHLVENGPDAWDCQPQNYTLMADIRKLLDGFANRFMVCEVPGDPQGFARVAGSAFAFDLNGALVAAARGDAAALQRVAAYFETAPPSISTLLSNHDAFAGRRVGDQLRGNAARCRIAAALLLLLPGTPFIYYGEEVGMAGARALQADLALRTPMSWTDDAQTAGFSTSRPFRTLAANSRTHNVAQQLGAPDSLHSFYKAMLALRNSRPSIARGDLASQTPAASSPQGGAARVDGAVLQFRRTLGAECTLVVINTGAGCTVELTDLGACAKLRHLHPAQHAETTADACGAVCLDLASNAVAVLDLS